MTRVFRIGLIALCLSLASCATPLDRPSGERSISEGSTSYDQVVKAFGRPDTETRNADGKRLVSYYLARMKRSFSGAMFGRLAKDQGKVEFRQLDIVFSPDKVVERYHYFETAQRVRSSFSYFEIGTAVDEAKLDGLKRSVTSRAELVEMFGAPTTEGLNFEGQIVLSWTYAKVGAVRSKETQTLSAVLDKNGKLDEYRVHESAR